LVLKKKSAPVNTKRKVEAPKPPIFSSKIVKEAWLITLAFIGIFLAIILFTYHYNDPAWSHSPDSHLQIANSGGPFGAYLSDFLFSIFGFSAWWSVALMCYATWVVYLRLDDNNEHYRFFLSSKFIGLLLLIMSSCALEAGHIVDLGFVLPQSPGGILGTLIDEVLQGVIGFTGATMFLVIMFMTGFSFFTGYSWIEITEKIGHYLLGAYQWLVFKWQDRQDKRIGKIVQQEREEYVHDQREKTKDRPPVQIETPVTEILKSERVLKEKQTTLFGSTDTGLPPLHLLDSAKNDVPLPSKETLDFTSRLIERKLLDFGIQVKVLTALPGPVITRYELEPSPGVKGSQVTNLVKDLARALSVVSVRVVETIPGKTCMGLEIPNVQRQIVYLSEIMSSKAYADVHSPLAISLGKDISGKAAVADLAKMPHVLVAGTTGSGKSVAINALILSVLYKATASQVRMILIDPKMLELSVYEDIPHLLAPVVTDMRQAANALNWCVAEMERRYKLMSAVGVRNLAGFNTKVREADKLGIKIPHPFSITPDEPEPLTEMPLIVVVIDELADLMMVVGKKVEELIARLAQKARAAGIHLVLATQRPSVDVITGLIKANVPTRISFQVSSKIDSRTILDQMGAEALLGQGDMLYMPPGTGYPVRVHGAFVSDQEVHKVVDYLKSQGEPNYIDGILSNEAEEVGTMDGGGGASGAEADPLYDQAVEIVLKSRRASISGVQRQLRIGYNRAARLIEDMERAGLVSAMQSNGNREVLAPKSGGDD
jgi:DNA segregation ATPase FtsK/SpoIIIE, S-DNA-T family